MCSHFPAATPAAIADGALGIGIGNGTEIYVGFPDESVVPRQDIAALKAWLAAHPVVLVYRLATPSTETITPVEITGVDGVNTVTSDGASVTVDYTGSGWAAVGAVQRMNVEAVTISPEQGLRVDTILTSDDGSQQVPTYFNARGKRFGLFRTADNRMLAGAGVMPDGRGYWAANVIRDPTSDLDLSFTVDAATLGANRKIFLNTNYGGASVGGMGVHTGDGGNVFFLGGGGSDVHIAPHVLEGTTMGNFALITMSDSVATGPVVGSGITLNVVTLNPNTLEMVYPSMYLGVMDHPDGAASFSCHVLPQDTNMYNLGNASIPLRWRRLYCVQSPDVSSDARLKQDIVDLDGGLVMGLRPRSYRLKADPDKLHFGLIAQEVKEALDELGIEGADLYGDENPDSLSLRYEELIAPLIAMAQAQQRRIDDLEARLAALEKQS